MTTQLHQLVAVRAATDPAILIGHALLTELLTRRLRDALLKFVGFFQTYPDAKGSIQIGLSACSYDHKVAVWKVTLPPAGAQPGLFFFESQSSFSVNFVVTKAGDAKVALFEVALQVFRIKAAGHVGYNALEVKDVAFDFDATILLNDNAAANATAIGLSDLDVARLQGLVQGAVAPSVLKNIFSGVPSLDLHSLFPTVVFDGEAELATVADGLLVIAKAGWHLDETQRCPCAGIPPEAVITPGAPQHDSESGGSIPVTVKIPPSRNPPWPVDNAVAADVALYLPKSSVDAITSGPYPAVNDFANDNGFIGWSYDYTIGFTNVNASITDPSATVVVSIEFYVSGSGEVTVDVPCIGRSSVGMFWATNRANGSSTIKFGLTPQLKPNGKIELVVELLKLDIKPFNVDCIVIALSLLSYFGPWGTLAAFVLNEIIRRVIAHNLPIKLRSAIADAMGKQMWTLVDLNKFDVRAVFGHTYRMLPAVSRNSDSLLIGLYADPG